MLCATSGAHAALILDAGWNNDGWSLQAFPGLTEDSQNPITEGYDFTLVQSALLTVTDAFVAGDTFNIYDGLTLLASSALLDGDPFGDGLGEDATDFDAALDSGSFHGVQLALGPGSYQLRIELTGGLLFGALGSRLDTTGTTSVPEPASLAVFGLGLAGLAFARRRRAA